MPAPRDDRAGRPEFAARALITAIAATGADLLIRAKTAAPLPGLCAAARRLVRDPARPGRGAGHRRRDHHRHHPGRRRGLPAGHHPARPRRPAAELVRLYHQRWEIETAYLELKQTILGGRVLRARTPSGSIRRSTPCWSPTRRCASRSPTPPRPPRSRTRPGQLHHRPQHRPRPGHPRRWCHHRHRHRRHRIDLLGAIGRARPGPPHARPPATVRPSRRQTSDLQ